MEYQDIQPSCPCRTAKRRVSECPPLVLQSVWSEDRPPRPLLREKVRGSVTNDLIHYHQHAESRDEGTTVSGRRFTILGV